MPHQLGLGGLEHFADGVALDQLGHLGADHVRAEQLAGLGVEHGLDEALGLAERDRLAVADERESAGLDGVARRLRIGLGQPDAGDLRMAVGAARDRVAVERVRVDVLVAELLGDRLGRGDALVARLVRQPRARRAVADRPQALGGGAAVGIDLDEAAVELGARLLEPEVLGVGGDADGDDDVAVLAGLDLAVLALDLRA